MHKAKTVLIISHFVTNSFVQLAVIASCIGFPRLDVSAQLMVVIPIAIDMITTAFTIKAAKEQLNPNEIVRYQFIDWPMAILGFFIIYRYPNSEIGIAGHYAAAAELLWLTERVAFLFPLMVKKKATKEPDLEEIMDLLGSDRTLDAQGYGIIKAKEIRPFFILIMPAGKTNAWQNCARVVSDKSDDELRPYFYDLLQWLRSLELPGASIMLNRLKQYQRKQTDEEQLEECLTMAEVHGENEWADHLRQLKDEGRRKEENAEDNSRK